MKVIKPYLFTTIADDRQFQEAACLPAQLSAYHLRNTVVGGLSTHPVVFIGIVIADRTPDAVLSHFDSSL